MRDASVITQTFKRYSVSSAELKAALGIDWPGHILSVSGDYYDGFTITMSTQPHELTGAQREQFTTNTTVQVPIQNPPAPAAEPAGTARKRWRRS